MFPFFQSGADIQLLHLRSPLSDSGPWEGMKFRRGQVDSGKVEFFLKGSLDSILSPSPSVKIQIIGGKVGLRFLGKTLLGAANKLFVFKSLLKRPGNVLPLHLK